MKIKTLSAGIAAVLMFFSGCSHSASEEVTTTTVAPAATASITTMETNPPKTVEASTDGQTTTEPASEEATKDPDAETELITGETTTAESVEVVSEPAGEASDDYRAYGENGILVIGRSGHYTGLMGCWGTFDLCDNYAAQVNKLATQLPDANVYSMVVPTSVEFYLPSDISGFTASQQEKINYITGMLSGASSVNVYDALKKHSDEPIYARTDHHWQPLGAYYAAEQFASKAGVDFPALSEYEAVSIDGYVGSLYTYSKDINLYNDAETFTMYLSPNADDITTTYYSTAFTNGYEDDLFVSRSAAAYYCSFLGSDDRIAQIDTNVENDKTLVIFKESYGNAIVPFLTSSYQHIYVCDIRYFSLNAAEFCKQVGADDVLFSVCTFTPAGTNCSYMNDIIR